MDVSGAGQICDGVNYFKVASRLCVILACPGLLVASIVCDSGASTCDMDPMRSGVVSADGCVAFVDVVRADSARASTCVRNGPRAWMRMDVSRK